MSAASVSSLSLHNGSLAFVASSPPDLLPRRASMVRFSPSLSLFDFSLSLSKTCLSPSLGRKLSRNLALVARASDLAQKLDPAVLDRDPVEGTYEIINNKLYIGNLPESYNSQQLAEIIKRVASVEAVEVVYDESGRSRGFALATMSSDEDSFDAISKLNGADYGGRTLRVRFAERGVGEDPFKPPSDDDDDDDGPPPSRFGQTPSRFGSSPSRFGSSPNRFGSSPGRSGPPQDSPNKLFVGNLPWGFDDASLEQLFSEHGKVIEARVIYDRESGRSRGFGFVTLATSTEANTAISRLDGADVDGRTLRVNLAANKPPPRRDSF